MTQSRLRITRLAVKYRAIVNSVIIDFALTKNNSHPNISKMVQLAPPPLHLLHFVSLILERMILQVQNIWSQEIGTTRLM